MKGRDCNFPFLHHRTPFATFAGTMETIDRLPLRKRILFALAPAVFLMCLILLAEGALRLFAPSLSNPLVEPIRIAGIDWYQVNRRYLTRYFPASTVTIPEVKSCLFRAKRGPSTVRILCLGESTMFGVPYQMSATIPAFIRKQLRHLYPAADIEVVSLAASAINSNVIADLGEAFIPYEPDCVLLYSGHNEYYGPDGVSAPWIERTFPSLISLRYQLRDWRLARVIEGWFSGQSGPAGEPNMMREVSGETLVPLRSPSADWVTENYLRNVRRIIGMCRAHRIPIIVSDVTSNLLFPPFATQSAGRQMTDDPRTEEFRHLVATDSISAITRLADHALALDSLDALATYWRGRTLLAAGRAAEARKWLERARDLDLLKFRAPSATIAGLAALCRQTGTILLPVDSLFAAKSGDGIAGGTLFWEHLHPTAEGYSLIADLFVGQIRDNLQLDRRFPPAASRLLPFDRDSLAIAWIDEAYADCSIQRLTSRWPFTHLTITPAALPLVDSIACAIARDVYAVRISWDDGCYRTADHFHRIGDLPRTLATYRAMVDDFVLNSRAQYELGLACIDAQQPDAAIAALSFAVRADPAYPYARLSLGLLLINRGSFTDAHAQFSAALQLLRPDQRREAATARYGLAAISANQGDLADALRSLDGALADAPDYAAALNLKRQILAFQRSPHK